MSSAFPAPGAPALRAMDGGRQVVYMNTFSRTLAPGLRLSFMVLPEELAGALSDDARGLHRTRL